MSASVLYGPGSKRNDPPTEMWCNQCGRFSSVYDEAGLPVCAACGEPFQCGECGAEVDLHGACQRPGDHFEDGEDRVGCNDGEREMLRA